MEINLFWNSTFIIALSQGLFVTLILFSQYFKNKHLSQLVLGIFLLAFTGILLNNLVFWNQQFDRFPQLIFSTISIRYLLAPLFFIYCHTFIKTSIGAKYLMHFLPFVLVTLLFTPVLFISGQEKLNLLNSAGNNIQGIYLWFSTFNKWLLSFQLIAYPLVLFYQLNEYQKNENQESKEKNGNRIKWLKFLNSLFLLYGLLMLFYFILVKFQIGGIEKDYYISLIMCIAVYSISYVGMVNPELLKGEHFLEKIPPLKYRKNRLEEDQLSTTIFKLEQLIQEEQIHLEAEVNLNLVAEKLNIPRHHISQALSLKLNKTFHEFINQHRIAHACQLLQNLPTGSNIKTVMYASGFNNRASFNNNFKKFNGKTASDFLKEVQISTDKEH